MLNRLGLNRLKVGGRLERESYYGEDNAKLSRDDEIWIEARLKMLEERGLVQGPQPVSGKPSPATRKWFKQFLRRNAATGIKSVDFTTEEAKRKITLPQDYKDFISQVGSKSFKNVNDMEETFTGILPPRKLDFKNHRRGKVPYLEGDDAEVDGVAFAEMDNGDCFVFDVSVKDSDYPVFWFRHEENTMEPFAPNFAECIKRFAQRT